MATTNDRRLQYQTADFVDLNNTQIGIMSGNDADLGFRMWGGKDGAGTVTRLLAKDQKIQVLDSNFSEYLYHTGDADTFIRYEDDSIKIQAGAVEMIRLTETTQDIITVNNGQVDVDFKINYNGAANAFFVEGSSGIVGIGTAVPTAGYKLDVQGGNLLIGTSQYPELHIVTNSASLGSAYVKVTGYKADENAYLGGILAYNLKNSASDDVAGIIFQRDANDDAGNIGLFTQPTGGALTQRMLIDSTGLVAVNHTAALASSRLTVLDASNPQLCLAYDADVYATLKMVYPGSDEVLIIEADQITFGGTTHVANAKVTIYPSTTGSNANLAFSDGVSSYTTISQLAEAIVFSMPYASDEYRFENSTGNFVLKETTDNFRMFDCHYYYNSSFNPDKKDYDFYVYGTQTAPLLFVDAGNNGVGVGESTLAATLDVCQCSSTGARPVMELDQDDQDETFINYVGTSAADETKSISTNDIANFTYTGMVKIDVNGSPYWMPYYTPSE